VQEGAYILCSDVEKGVGWWNTLVKTKFLALPTKAAPHLVAMKTPMHVQAVLQPMVAEILNDLRDTPITVADSSAATL
jgi:hypothetical protein